MCYLSTSLVGKGLFFVDVGLVLCSILDQILFSGCDLILMIGTITTENNLHAEKN
jgi:hypothetical protein